jgi:hypothetical protein
MAATKNPAARDVQNRPQNFRVKKDEFEFGGMIPDGDAGQLPPNRPRLLVNARLRGGHIVPRAGQSQFASLGGKVRGLFDFQLGTKRRLMIVGDGCPDLSNSVGFYLGSKDNEQVIPIQPAVYYDASTVGVHLSKHGDFLYIGQDANLRVWQTIDPPFGETGLSLSGISQDILIYTLETPYTAISAIGGYEFAGLLFIGANGGAGASAAKTFDGKTIRDDLVAIDPPSGFGEYRELLIMGFRTGTNAIKTRNVSGSWSTIAPGAGTCTFHEGKSYRDRFYITTLGEDLFVFNGTTLTRINAATSGVGAGSITYGIEAFNGLLYIAYTTAAGVAKLATFDGTTWDPDHKIFTDQFHDCNAARPLRAYRGGLTVGVLEFNIATGTRGTLYASPQSDTAGTWVRSAPGTTNQGSINEFVVF